MHMCSCETKWLEQGMHDITDTRSYCSETNSLTCLWWWRWWANANLGCPWWCACAQWWHLVEENSCLRCILVHCYGSFIQSVCYHAHGLLGCGQTRNTLMHSVCVDILVCGVGHVHQLSNTCSSPVGLASCLHLGECAEWVGSHVCA